MCITPWLIKKAKNEETMVVNGALNAFVAQKESADCQVLQLAQCGGGKEACTT